eukprot:RCo032067
MTTEEECVDTFAEGPVLSEYGAAPRRRATPCTVPTDAESDEELENDLPARPPSSPVPTLQGEEESVDEETDGAPSQKRRYVEPAAEKACDGSGPQTEAARAPAEEEAQKAKKQRALESARRRRRTEARKMEELEAFAQRCFELQALLSAVERKYNAVKAVNEMLRRQ